MTRDDAIDRLPTVYATALRLADAGTDAARIAAELGIEDAATLLLIGERKLAAILDVD
jgi:hypothetical protein